MIVTARHHPPHASSVPRATPPVGSGPDATGLPPSQAVPNDRVLRVRRLLQMGLLDTPERLDAAIDKLFDAEFNA
ncbi:MAG: hypothetical protein AAGI68_08315 [Planctomycetota bacterium]